MVYFKWTSGELATLEHRALYTEIDDDGWVQRELGIDDDGFVTHQLIPSSTDPGWFGGARLAPFMLSGNVTKDEFERLWIAGMAGRPPLPRR
jgi:hypothetical protein